MQQQKIINIQNKIITKIMTIISTNKASNNQSGNQKTVAIIIKTNNSKVMINENFIKHKKR